MFMKRKVYYYCFQESLGMALNISFSVSFVTEPNALVPWLNLEYSRQRCWFSYLSQIVPFLCLVSDVDIYL